MINTCPSCGAQYTVAEKDIGRKIKCKKCSSALRVSDAGLEFDTAAPAPIGGPVEDDGGAPVLRRSRLPRLPGGSPLDAIGGVPTLLFGVGVFFVIVFTSLPVIGQAGTDRAVAYVDKLKLEQKNRLDALIPRGKKEADLTEAERQRIAEDAKKVNEEFDKRIRDAGLDAEGTRIGNRRDVWLERYGLMFGFLFVAFGCIGYLRGEPALIMRIVAAVILTFMMLVMFLSFGGGCGGGGLVPKG